jgi:NitT/TauT family transport system substrate-binding protein
MKPSYRSKQLSRRTFLKQFAAYGAGATALSALPGLLAACSPATPGATAAPTISAVTLAPTAIPIVDFKVQLNWIETIGWGAFFAAEQQGFDLENGIRQEFIPGGPQIDPIQAVAGGAAHMGIAGGLNQHILARANGLPIKAFGTMHQRLPFGLISFTDNPIRTPQDAVGKRVGLQSGARSTWALIMSANGMSEEQMTIIPVGVDPTPLVSGEVDGYWGTANGQLIALRNQGLDVDIMLMSDAGVPGYGTVFIAPDRVLNEQHDLLVRWLKGTIHGGRYFLDNREAIAEYTVQREPELNLNLQDMKDQAEASAPFFESPLTAEKGMFWMDPAVAENLVQVMLDSGQIEAAVDVDDLMTTSVLEAAYS